VTRLLLRVQVLRTLARILLHIPMIAACALAEVARHTTDAQVLPAAIDFATSRKVFSH
jgi:hypothetical protein